MRSSSSSRTEFPYTSSSLLEFQRQFFAPGSQLYVCRSLTQEVIGAFYIRPNFTGRCDHIANAAYMIHGSHRGKGIGKALIQASLAIAKKLGFRAMQFNMVFAQNTIAIKLYEKLGFQIIATIPQAIRNDDGTYQDGYIFY